MRYRDIKKYRYNRQREHKILLKEWCSNEFIIVLESLFWCSFRNTFLKNTSGRLLLKSFFQNSKTHLWWEPCGYDYGKLCFTTKTKKKSLYKHYENLFNAKFWWLEHLEDSRRCKWLEDTAPLFSKDGISVVVTEILGRNSYNIEPNQLIFRDNWWTGFYMTEMYVMKELRKWIM